MKPINKCFIVLIFSGSNLFYSCIDDNITPPLTGDLGNTEEMLVYFEEQGDFVNSFLAPALVNAEEVYSNLNSYLVIDIRRPEEFATGHIEGSINVQYDSLYDFLNNSDHSIYSKIILVSKNGQSSSYYTCLARLAGFDKVFTMNFGLASWNEFFADEWFNAIGNDPVIDTYINDAVSKNNFTNLPEVTFENPDDPIETKTKERIKRIISEGFENGIQYKNNLFGTSNEYLVCYGSARLYYARGEGPLAELGHNASAAFYMSDPLYELRAVNSLQTLPVDNRIIAYDETGQLSACVAAYLRVLGYDARTLLFGGNQLIYDRMIGDPDIGSFAFDITDIKNYPYVNGE